MNVLHNDKYGPLVVLLRNNKDKWSDHHIPSLQWISLTLFTTKPISQVPKNKYNHVYSQILPQIPSSVANTNFFLKQYMHFTSTRLSLELLALLLTITMSPMIDKVLHCSFLSWALFYPQPPRRQGVRIKWFENESRNTQCFLPDNNTFWNFLSVYFFSRHCYKTLSIILCIPTLTLWDKSYYFPHFADA